MIIDGVEINSENSPWIVAEVGASHNGSFERAMDLVAKAKLCGADAVKFQCFTADTLTIDCDRPEFVIQDGPWQGMKLYELYKRAAMPWDWFPKLFVLARDLGIVPFATVFDKTSVDYMMELGAPAMKIASFECVDLPLIRYAASKGVPLIISTGMADDDEYFDAIEAAHDVLPVNNVCMMNCVSSYPCKPEKYSISDLVAGEDGISDHTIGNDVAVVATVVGALIIEKHLTLSRADGGLDDGFASEPHEFASMVQSVRSVKAMLRNTKTDADSVHRPLRRSLYVVKAISCGEKFTEENIRSIRPANGLAPRWLPVVLGKEAAVDLPFGTPLEEGHVRGIEEMRKMSSSGDV